MDKAKLMAKTPEIHNGLKQNVNQFAKAENESEDIIYKIL